MVSPLALCSSMRLKFFERFGVGWLGEGGEAEVAGSVASRAHMDAISRRHPFLPQPGHPHARLHEFVAHNKTLLPAADAGAQLRCARRTRALQLICFVASWSQLATIFICKSVSVPPRALAHSPPPCIRAHRVTSRLRPCGAVRHPAARGAWRSAWRLTQWTSSSAARPSRRRCARACAGGGYIANHAAGAAATAGSVSRTATCGRGAHRACGLKPSEAHKSEVPPRGS